MCQSDFSLEDTHGYFDHGDDHDHLLISDMGDVLPDGMEAPTPTTEDKSDKKKQTTPDQYPKRTSLTKHLHHEYAYMYSGYEVYLNNDTPPPIHSVAST